MLKLSKGQVSSWRMSKHHLVHRASSKAIAGVVSDVCGIQAQVLNAAELAIRARVDGITREDVRRALWKDHSIVKTWCMRGTLHLLATSDLPTYVAALKTKLSADEEWLRKQGVQPSEVQAITREIKQILDDRTIARENLAREVERKTKLSRAAKKGLRSAWGILLRPAAYQGALAFGPSIGSMTTLFRPDRLVRSWKEPSTKEAFIELFNKYVQSYGPVTIGDFAHWWGNLRDEEKSILETVHDDLVEVQVGEHRGLMARTDAEEASGVGQMHAVRLLPSFDCYAMFYTPRDAFVPRAHRTRVFRQLAGWNYPTLVVDGFAVGIWELKRRARKVEINIENFGELATVEKRRIQEEASDIGRFYGLRVEVRYAPVG
jgi:hypothetical protein